MKKLQLALLFLLLNLCFTLKIHSWTNPTDCEAPIRIVSLFFFIIWLALILRSGCLQAHLPHSSQKWFTYLDDFLLSPMLIYLTFQGIRWRINIGLSQECEAKASFCAICIYISGAFHTITELLKLHDWWFGLRLRQREPVRYRIRLIFSGRNEQKNSQLLGQLEDFLRKRKEIRRLTGNFAEPVEEMLSESHLETCSICFEDYCVGDEVVSLPKCKHVFHWECVSKWLLRNPFCPLCRSDVLSSLFDVRGQPQENE